ncbi:MAG: tRNA uridine-5-carboxymethylaminomethyl(34) synthesis enzyme MnmG [Lachnospiraceae bacterium]|nr:tRNA uridine-5-carboxymethylaminomethyl(34) synthesis enzyme MnmG [Lachnospiraceae bacterium]
MSFVYEGYDVIVIGAGHAGCEAALAAARLGMKTLIFTVSIDSVAMMPCNPNVGGSSKGHLVREVDALGGEMGKNIDKTFIQSKMLNLSKGPAVHSLRAQADKKDYSQAMRRVLENTENLTLKQGEVAEVLAVSDESDISSFENLDFSDLKEIECKLDELYSEKMISEEFGKSEESRKMKVIGVRTTSGAIYLCNAVVMCTGTYLKARCIYGDVSQYTGPNGLSAANHLTDSLIKLGIDVRRFKTGTPARVDGRTVDFSKMQEQKGDEKIVPFSFTNHPADLEREQVSCWLTYTNEETHQIIRENIDRSPLYSGNIKGTGPRYCPSIEDKVMRFADRERHQVFLEPEGNYTNEMYIGGMSSSLPEDVQEKMYHTVPGLEHANIVRHAYAIEYDCIDPVQLKASLEFKDIDGFFSAGQANGSSGYEEAAAQGIIAGINAARKVSGKDPVILNRSQAYIGVLIDDLITKGTNEPYRMMTSRAEYRLLLRQDNADLRLTEIGYEIGLISEERYKKLCEKKNQIEKEIFRLKETTVGTSERVQSFLEKHGSTLLQSGSTLEELTKRPELSYEILSEIDEGRPELSSEVKEQVNINLKYSGYIERQKRQVKQYQKMESKKIPDDIDYDDVYSLRLEAVQKLKQFRPASVGQASRISGVSPSDISVLLIYLEKFKK